MVEVYEDDEGRLVLDDPQAMAVAVVVAKLDCGILFDGNWEAILHFKTRLSAKNLTPADAVIVVLNVDDSLAGPLAESLMPGHNWQEYRDRGEIPIARGLAGREGIQNVLDLVDPEAGEKLKNLEPHQVGVVVMDRGVAEVFSC